MTTHDGPGACPWCGRRIDAMTNAGASSEPPRVGDVAVCWGCRRPAIVTEGGGQRRATAEELEQLEEALRPVLAAMTEAHTPRQAGGLLSHPE